jgi:hypothetical protein
MNSTKTLRKSYWQYIENMIFDIDIQDTDSNRFNKQPKNLFSYMKSQKNENTGITPLRSEFFPALCQSGLVSKGR